MKNLFRLACITILAGTIIGSCSSGNSEFATITGKYLGDASKTELQLSQSIHGSLQPVATTNIGAEGMFSFSYAVEEEGLYVVNLVSSESGKKAIKDHDLKRFYLEKGTEIDVIISDDKYSLVKTNSKENELLSEWNALIDTVYSYSHGFMYNFVDFETYFPLLPDYLNAADEFQMKIGTGNSEFDELLNYLVEVEMSYTSLNFIYTPRAKHPEREVYPEFYDEILLDGSPSSELLLELPFGLSYLREFTMFAVMSSPDVQQQDRMMKSFDYIPSDLIKGYYAIQNMSRFRTYDESYMEFKKTITPYLLNEYLVEKLDVFETSIRKFGPGEMAIDFSGTDINEQEIQLSDFLGKLVYVDVWATWCGPCKVEIPHLKKLEEKYHANEIVFLSISVDAPKDREKWKTFVSTEELKGVQIMADKGFESKVSQAYKIKGIPRFMLFDKEGKIVTIDAPRPSNNQVNDLINSHL